MTVAQDPFVSANDSLSYPAPQPTRFLARQPILDARRNVIGYELLFRSGWENCFRGEPDDATRQMLDNCVMMGIESLTSNKLAFVNCTREALIGGMVRLLPPATTVLEILETIEPDAELVKCCRALRHLGYMFALDDFVATPSMRPLIDLASFVKVDLRVSDVGMRRKVHEMVRGTKVALLAEKVEDQDEFNIALSEGYEYFQGYFFCRPRILSEREIPPNQVNYLRLLVELTRTPLNLREVERIVLSETSLCYRLLRLANSPLMAVRAEVHSIRGAMVMVGEDRFRTLVSVAASSALGQNQPQALIALSLERARFCELLAPQIGESPNEQYMLGLLSLVDAILQIPMESVVKSLPLRDEAKAALMGVVNSVAIPLTLIRSFECGEWGPCFQAAQNLGVDEETLASLYVDSLKWAANALAFAG